jgi:hypothetical protein
MWQGGGLVAVGIMLLVILALTLNALVVVHNNRVHGTGTSVGLDRRRPMTGAAPSRRRGRLVDKPQVRRGGGNETAPVRASDADTSPPVPSKAAATTVTKKPAGGDKVASTGGLVDDASFFQRRPTESNSGAASAAGKSSTASGSASSKPAGTRLQGAPSCRARQGVTTTDIWLVHVPAGTIVSS